MFEQLYQKLSTPTKETGSCNIVCFGDSVTQGCFESGVSMHTSHDVFNSYTRKLHTSLQKLYPSKVINVINSGIGGDNATRALERFDRDVLAYHPDLVIIAFGVNDFGNTDSYIHSIGKMFDMLNERNIPCIYMTEHMMNTYSADDTAAGVKAYSEVTAKAQTDGTMDNLFDRGITLAKEKGVAVCDVYHKWKKLNEAGIDTTLLLANRINHPSRDMHDLFVSSLISTIFNF